MHSTVLKQLDIASSITNTQCQPYISWLHKGYCDRISDYFAQFWRPSSQGSIACMAPLDWWIGVSRVYTSRSELVISGGLQDELNPVNGSSKVARRGSWYTKS